MGRLRTRISSASHFTHKHFLWFVLGSYVVAAAWPAPGLWIRGVSAGQVTTFGETTRLSLPVILLSLLLLNAGLGVPTAALGDLFRRPLPLAAGLLGNLLVPVAFIFGVAQTLRLWHNPDEVQNILVGLALVASMPIAGSSTAWSQNANGHLALSLGLVVLSTLLSPVTTPVALRAVGLMATGDYAEDLRELATSGTGGFLAVAVIVPTLLGMAGHAAAGGRRIGAVKPELKLLNSVTLLLLNYSNASVSLPQVMAAPDWDFLAVILAVVASLCTFAFAAGWLIARVLRVDAPRRVSLMFGLGMNNNGTGLVLAALSLADHPRVLLPIIFYNLVQHLVAGAIGRVLSKSTAVDSG